MTDETHHDFIVWEYGAIASAEWTGGLSAPQIVRDVMGPETAARTYVIEQNSSHLNRIVSVASDVLTYRVAVARADANGELQLFEVTLQLESQRQWKKKDGEA